VGLWDENRGEEANCEVMRECCCRVQSQEEEILDNDWSARDKGCSERWVIFEAGPGQVDVEEEKKDSQTDDRPLHLLQLA
jgi:hypothetical protein